MMSWRVLLIKAGVCLVALGFVLYRHVDEQNKITTLKIALPQVIKELKILKEEALHLRYRIEQFENSENLLAISRKSEFGHLKYPLTKELIAMTNSSTGLEDQEVLIQGRPASSVTFATIQK